MKNFTKLFGISGGNAAPEVAMPLTATENTADHSEIQDINIKEIFPNPFQPRKIFNDEALAELAASIREHGIIQPVLVRRSGAGFELIAGERRLRAAGIAGLSTVPVIIREINDRDMAELAMIENLQREDLHYLEEAEGFQLLLLNFGMTQEELAHRVGKNQSTIANKLRLLRLTPEVRQALTNDHLTERHARALLKLEDPVKLQEALDIIRQNGLNVRETEALVEEIIEDISREMANKKPHQNVVKVIRDVRIFVNTINSVVNEMKKAGLKVKVNQDQDDDYIMINLKIPKRRNK